MAAAASSVKNTGIGFIGTFPDSREDYRTKHEISGNYRFHAVNYSSIKLKATQITLNSELLIEFYTYGSVDFVVFRITILENSWIQVSAVIVPFLSG